MIACTYMVRWVKVLLTTKPVFSNFETNPNKEDLKHSHKIIKAMQKQIMINCSKKNKNINLHHSFLCAKISRIKNELGFEIDREVERMT